MKKSFISGIIVVYFFTSEKHVIETFRELAIFIEIHNFSYLKRNDILKFQQFQTFKNWLSVSIESTSRNCSNSTFL